MKLFLGGGGDSIDSYELDKKFAEALDLTKPLLYIPIAMSIIENPYQDCINWLFDTLRPHGVVDIVMWTEEDLKIKTREDFNDFGGIYIGGGNTYKLLKELKGFGIFKIILNLATSGMPIYGGSAGAIIMAKTIITAGFRDVNNVDLKDFSALNLLNGYDVWCHYIDSEDKSITEYMSNFCLDKIIAIPENAGLIVTESEINAVGSGEIFIFNPDKIKFTGGLSEY